MSDPLLITVAPTGAETAKEDCPQLPTTPEEIAATARACEAAGAAMIHLHVRDAEHRPTLDAGLLKEWVAAVRDSSDLVVQLSTGGSVHDPLDQRLKVLDAEPDSCSLTMGTTNFGDDVFSNPWPFVCELYQLAQERGVVPGVRAVRPRPGARADPAAGPLRPARRRQGPRRPGDGRARRHERYDGRAGRRRPRPAGRATTSWSATGIGRSTLAVMLASLSKGGHLRVGMEDVLTISRGVPVESNAQLVERAVAIGAAVQRTPMTHGRGARADRRPRVGLTRDQGFGTGCLAARLPVAAGLVSAAYSYVV